MAFSLDVTVCCCLSAPFLSKSLQLSLTHSVIKPTPYPWRDSKLSLRWSVVWPRIGWCWRQPVRWVQNNMAYLRIVFAVAAKSPSTRTIDGAPMTRPFVGTWLQVPAGEVPGPRWTQDLSHEEFCLRLHDFF